jgi:hypothetical protein
MRNSAALINPQSAIRIPHSAIEGAEMADVEVEDTLREIRERVLAASESRAAERANAQTYAPEGAAGPPAQASAGDAGEALARMGANISTTGRAWSRLPPVLTYRRGALARLELWLKRLVKRAAHWFTWEQVNFNSAAHQALADAREALEAHGRALEALRGEVGLLRAEVESGVSELNARAYAAEARLESELAGLRAALASVTDEQRVRADAALEEQRVCFRQLSLEAAELAVAHDRARRQLESRVGALEKRQSGV